MPSVSPSVAQINYWQYYWLPLVQLIHGNNRSCSNRAGFHSGHAGTTETCVRTRKWIASEKLSSPRTSTLGFPSAVDGIPYQPKQLVLAVKRVVPFSTISPMTNCPAFLSYSYFIMSCTQVPYRYASLSNPLSHHILLARTRTVHQIRNTVRKSSSINHNATTCALSCSCLL